jgi:hypothetical protein
MPRCSLGPQGRAEPAPPGGASPLRMAYRGRPGDHVKGGFLGGAHSVRPLDTAPTNAKAFHYGQGVGPIAGGLLVTCLASARALLTGVQSPPLRGGLAQHGWPCGERSEMTPRDSSRRGAVSAPMWQGRTQAEA